VVNWAGMVAFFSGIVMTWLFMYGMVPALQGPVARAMHGVDLSWLAGGLTSALVYAALGPAVARKYEQAPTPSGTTVGVEGAVA
jgi:toxin CptA